MNTMAEKSLLNTPLQEHPLPAYEEVESRPAYAAAIDTKGKPILFPKECVFTYRMTHSHSHIGATKGEPLFLVRTPRFTIGSGDIILLSGTDKLDTPLASVGALKIKSSTACAAELRLKPRPGGSFTQPIGINMTVGAKNKYQFTIPVGPAGQQETFEWRQSTGELVRDLVGGFQYGMKLVRLDAPAGGSGNNGEVTVVAGDGKPLVAIFAAMRPQANNAKFHFMNEGATGELGEIFELAAMISFMRLFELQLSQGGVAIGPCFGSIGSS